MSFNQGGIPFLVFVGDVVVRHDPPNSTNSSDSEVSVGDGARVTSLDLVGYVVGRFRS